MVSSVETRTATAVIRIDGDEADEISEPVPIRRARAPRVRQAHRPTGGFDLLHQIFEAQADARPEAVAVVFERAETTYAALERRANQLAHHLRARGVRRGSLVAMLLPRSADEIGRASCRERVVEWGGDGVYS